MSSEAAGARVWGGHGPADADGKLRGLCKRRPASGLEGTEGKGKSPLGACGLCWRTGQAPGRAVEGDCCSSLLSTGGQGGAVSEGPRPEDLDTDPLEAFTAPEIPMGLVIPRLDLLLAMLSRSFVGQSCKRRCPAGSSPRS